MSISPKDFLKARKPKQFSDTDFSTEKRITRPELEGHLDTLTSRSEELLFEGFAKGLCELEICPNLLPHTGPTGGGDSKVDSETYPVSELTALNWYIGNPDKAAKEKWGFAFSAKKDWKPKVKKDVKEIVGTKRGYKRIYFVSNQYIKDKDRAATEDELKKTYKVDVHILDRNWILDKVFSNQRLDLVEEKLKVELFEEKKLKKGPLDLQKESTLTELDQHIEKDVANGAISHETVNRAIDSAIVARELEKPRIEIDGRFQRAVRLANDYGSDYQKFEALYQQAWTNFWWHEDFSLFVREYSTAEEVGLKTNNIYNLERITNLWNLLSSVRDKDKSLVEDVFYVEKTKNIMDKLSEASKEEEKPSASLYARSLLLTIQLHQDYVNSGNFDQTLRDIKEVVLSSKNLIGFPLQPLVQVLTEVGDILESSGVYEELFNVITETVAERDGEISSAKLSLERGRKLLQLQKPYDAIRVLNQAVKKLYKNETKEEMVEALFFLGVAYEEVGLLWAARGVTLSAASLATSDYWTYDEINGLQALCYGRLKWIELRLGRLPQMLEWNEVDNGIKFALLTKGFEKEKLFDEPDMFDLSMGALFLTANLEVLKKLEYLPDVLDSKALHNASMALIYALGHIEDIAEEFKETLPLEEVDDFMATWVSRVEEGRFPYGLNIFEDKAKLSSNVLGCKIELNTPNKEPYIELGESLLAAIESFLSTGVPLEAVSKEPSIEINIIPDESIEGLITCEVNNKEDRPIVNIRCKDFNPHSITAENRELLNKGLFDALVQTFAHFIMFKNPEEDLVTLMRDESALDRAFNLTGSFVTLGNVLGHKPDLVLPEANGVKVFGLNRKEELKLEAKREKTPEDKKPRTQLKHSEMETVSIIRESLWDEAKWQGALYGFGPEDPPILGLIFTSEEAARKIFDYWYAKFGEVDKSDDIRITIIKEISVTNPFHYRLIIGPNIDSLKKEGHLALSFRIHTMTPASFTNVDGFMDALNKQGYYWLVPAVMEKDGARLIKDAKAIVKRKVFIRKASEIKEDDIDYVGVRVPEESSKLTDAGKALVDELLKKKTD